MTKISTVGTRQTRNFAEQQLTIGLDLGDRSGVISIRDFPFAHRSDSLASSESQNTPPGVWQDCFRTSVELGWQVQDRISKFRPNLKESNA
jgi:hypothetical protein